MTNTFYLALQSDVYSEVQRTETIRQQWFGGCVPLKQDREAAVQAAGEAYRLRGNRDPFNVIELNVTDTIVTSWVMGDGIQIVPWLRGWRVFADIGIDDTNVTISNAVRMKP